MITILTTSIHERATAKFTVAFTDEGGSAATPTAASWTLTDGGENIVNSRSDVAISPPSSSVTLALKDADLQIGDYGVYRVLTVKYTYDSSLGTALPGRDQVGFYIDDIA